MCCNMVQNDPEVREQWYGENKKAIVIIAGGGQFKMGGRKKRKHSTWHEVPRSLWYPKFRTNSE